MKKHEAETGTFVYVDTTDPSWEGVIVEMKKGSNTKVIVEDTDRGAGWSEDKQMYVGVAMPPSIEKGVKIAGGWVRGENADYGKRYEVHIRDCRLREEIID